MFLFALSLFSSGFLPFSPRMTARLANFINLVDEIDCLLIQNKVVPELKWAALIRNSKAMGTRYGTPALGELHLQSDRAALQVLEATKSFYEKALIEEWQHRQHHFNVDFRTRLHEHGGVNKFVTKLLNGQPKKGELVVDGTEVKNMWQQLQIPQQPGRSS